MEPEGSSPHSQAHATCPYPELPSSSPHTHFPNIHPNMRIIVKSKFKWPRGKQLLHILYKFQNIYGGTE